MKNLTLNAAKIAEVVKGQIVGDPERTITGVSGIREAKNTDLSFVGNKRYEKQLSETAAGIILVCADLALLDQSMTRNNNEKLPLGVMPMLSLGDTGF